MNGTLPITISSSWLVVNGDVYSATADGRRSNGRAVRRKTGKKTSAEALEEQRQRAEYARELRRQGLESTKRYD